VNNNKKV